MKIIIDKPGQTCNRLWSYVALISEAITNNDNVAILHFDKTIDDFPNLIYSKHVIFPYYNEVLISLFGVKNYLYMLQKVFFNRFTISLTEKYWRKKGDLINGWDFRGENIDFDKNKEQLQNIFKPADYITETIDEMVSSLRKGYDEIVGIHIRRSDYATWLNGRYFFDVKDYYTPMLEYQKNNIKKTCFFISSDEDIDLDNFEGLKCFKHKKTSAILDLYSLAHCDKIIGPLSTYSRWASFYGEVPLSVLERKDNALTRTEFSVVKSLYKTANGYIFTNWTDKLK